MKTKLFGLFLLALFSFNLLSCSKDDEEPLSKSEILVGKGWDLYKSESYDLNNNFVSERTYDDLNFFFNDNNLFYIKLDDGTIKEEGEWDLNKDETKLYLIDSSDHIGEVLEIRKLDQDEMILAEPIDPAIKGKIYTYAVYYLKRLP